MELEALHKANEIANVDEVTAVVGTYIVVIDHRRVRVEITYQPFVAESLQYLAVPDQALYVDDHRYFPMRHGRSHAAALCEVARDLAELATRKDATIEWVPADED